MTRALPASGGQELIHLLGGIAPMQPLLDLGHTPDALAQLPEDARRAELRDAVDRG